MTRPTYRSLRECTDDALWLDPPTAAGQLPPAGLRRQAIEEVLCGLPPAPYERLRGRADRFRWFVPSDHVLGQVYPLLATQQPLAGDGPRAVQCRVLYLSPQLEQHKLAVVVTVVVHELAHIILDHDLFELDKQQSAQQEKDVRTALRDWGFARVADQADAALLHHVLERLTHPPAPVERTIPY